MANEVLSGDQYPKGLTEEEVRTIARTEAMNVLRTLGEELATNPLRADRNINVDDFQMSLSIVMKKIETETS